MAGSEPEQARVGVVGRFAMVEEWDGEQALATHLDQESLQQAVGALTPMASGPVSMQRFVRRA